MNQFYQNMINIINDARPIVIIVAIIALFISGVALAWPAESVKSGAKRALPWIVVGVGIALSAVTIGTTLASNF